MKHLVKHSIFKRALCLMLVAILLCCAACAPAAAPEQAPAATTPAPAVVALTPAPTPTPVPWDVEIDALLAERRYPEAMGRLMAMPENETAQKLLAEIRYIVDGDYIDDDGGMVAAILSEGGVAIAGDRKPSWDYPDTLDDGAWADVTHIFLSAYNGILGLSGGRIVTEGLYTLEWMRGQQNAPLNNAADGLEFLQGLFAIQDLSADFPHTFATLCTDGVYASCMVQEDVQGIPGKLPGWEDVLCVKADGSCLLGLLPDGSVKYHNGNRYDPLDVSGWTDIVAMDIDYAALGLRSDGSVVCAGGETYGGIDTSGWKDIIAISTAEGHALGLKRDGTVVASGNNEAGQLDVSDWTDIVAIDTDAYTSIGLKADGTMVIAGGNHPFSAPLPDVSGLKGLYVPGPVTVASMGEETVYLPVQYNTQETAALQHSLPVEEQIQAYAFGQLMERMRMDERFMAEEEAAAIEKLVFARFDELGITLPKDAYFTEGFSNYYGEAYIGEKQYRAYLVPMLTRTGVPQEDDHANIAACMLEITEGGAYYPEHAYIGMDLPEYITRIPLPVSEPARGSLFILEGENGLNCYVEFYHYDVSDSVYTDCYLVAQAGDGYTCRAISSGELLDAWFAHLQQSGYAQMLSRLESGDFSVQPHLDHGLMEEGSMVVDELYRGVSYQHSPSLTISYEHDDDEEALSRWALRLEGKELGLVEGELELASNLPFTTHVYTADLSGDHMEEIILHICPEGGDPIAEGELHVFSQQNGGNTRERVFHPFVGEALDHVLALKSGGEYGSFSTVDIIGTGALDVMRLSGDGEDVLLWYNYDSEWERAG